MLRIVRMTQVFSCSKISNKRELRQLSDSATKWRPIIFNMDSRYFYRKKYL